jgi:hypothetical protein
VYLVEIASSCFDPMLRVECELDLQREGYIIEKGVRV